jgi:hypothetical protein
MLVKYRQAYYRAMGADFNGMPSVRMLAWIDEYNDACENSPDAWAQHCRNTGSTPTHDAYDLFA